VLGLVAFFYSAMGLASLSDALAGTHLASVDRPRSDAAIWGVIGVLIAAALIRWCVRQLRRERQTSDSLR
jgi:hypothetical protein